jgi:probable rRNA maturation factor
VTQYGPAVGVPRGFLVRKPGCSGTASGDSGRGPVVRPSPGLVSMEEKGEKDSIDIRGFPARFRHLKSGYEQVVRRILESNGVASYALSISFVNDKAMADLNRERLGRPGPTDVIAFDLSEPGLPLDRVGDIYISTDTALRNSARFHVVPEEELLRLVVHGVLHVLGYTDREAPEALRMNRAQERIVKDFQSFVQSDEE